MSNKPVRADKLIAAHALATTQSTTDLSSLVEDVDAALGAARLSQTNLPLEMTSPENGERLARGVRPFTVSYKGESISVELPGYYPIGQGEGVHVGADMSIVEAALRALKEKIDGVPTPATIRRVRRKLKLTQRAAGALLKVGDKAFDKYERGLIEPSGPTSQLIRILDRRPEIAEDLK